MIEIFVIIVVVVAISPVLIFGSIFWICTETLFTMRDYAEASGFINPMLIGNLLQSKYASASCMIDWLNILAIATIGKDALNKEVHMQAIYNED